MVLPPSTDTPYAPFMEEQAIKWSIPKVEKTETNEDYDLLFLAETSSESQFLMHPTPPLGTYLSSPMLSMP